ncbi:MAG: hypothetical protein N2Z57_06885 [Oscillospiraceae bacterium]|nr:hypothetical protein [Oscillospiraceae bacterium]
MDFSAFLDKVCAALKGDLNIPFLRTFEDENFPKDSVFAAAGFSDIKSGEAFGDAGNLPRMLSAQIKVSLFGMAGAKLPELFEKMLLNLFSSDTIPASAETGELSYNTRLSRLQYDFSLTFEGCFGTNGFLLSNCAENFSFGTLSLAADSFELSRERPSALVDTVCGEIIPADEGSAPAELKLHGKKPLKSGFAQSLDVMLRSGESLALSGAGISFPPMRLKKYSLISSNGIFEEWELIFGSTTGKGAVANG